MIEMLLILLAWASAAMAGAATSQQRYGWAVFMALSAVLTVIRSIAP